MTDFNKEFARVQSTLSSKVRAVNFYVRILPSTYPAVAREILTSTFENADDAERAYFFAYDQWQAAASYVREKAGGPWMLAEVFDLDGNN